MKSVNTVIKLIVNTKLNYIKKFKVKFNRVKNLTFYKIGVVL